MKPEKKEEPLSILLLGTQMAVGGAQKVLLDQARWFHSRDIPVYVAFFYDRDGLREKWQKAYPFPIHDLQAFRPGAVRLHNAGRLLGGLLRLRRLIHRGQVNAVEAFTHDSNLLGLPLAWLAGVRRRIATYHGVVEKMPRWREWLHARMVNFGIATCLVVVTPLLRQRALSEGVRERRIVTIPNGIDLPDVSPGQVEKVRLALGVRPDDLFLLSVGRLTGQKAHAVLIRAMADIAQRKKQLRLYIAGDGPLRRELTELIGKLELGRHVYLLGEREDIPQLLSAADMFILPSRSEGLPIALLEAMGAGLAVVATRTGGIADLVEVGVTGMLVDPDQPAALASAITRLIDDPALRRRLGQAAREKVKNSYTLEKMCVTYLDLMKHFSAV